MAADLIELYGGPGDGLVLAVPEDAQVWVIPTPQMTPAQFLAMENGGPYDGVNVPVQEHVYARTEDFGPRSHARLFRYRGSRLHEKPAERNH